jgi:hypothetical protein
VIHQYIRIVQHNRGWNVEYLVPTAGDGIRNALYTVLCYQIAEDDVNLLWDVRRGSRHLARL